MAKETLEEGLERLRTDEDLRIIEAVKTLNLREQHAYLTGFSDCLLYIENIERYKNRRLHE